MKKKWLFPSLNLMVISAIVAACVCLVDYLLHGFEPQLLNIPGLHFSIVLSAWQKYLAAFTCMGYVALCTYGFTTRFKHYIANIFFLTYSVTYCISLLLPLLNKTKGTENSNFITWQMHMEFPLFILFLAVSFLVMILSGAVAYKTYLQLGRIRKWRASMAQPVWTKQKAVPKL